MHRTLLCTPLLLCLSLAPACGGGEAKKDEKVTETKSVTKHSCTIMVAKKVTDKFEASASDPDQAKAKEAAWTAVCAKLPEADRAACKDDKKFAVTESGGSMTSSGKTTHSVNLSLVPIVATHEGQGTSEASKDEACKAALEKACEAAGEKGDCLAGGKFEKKGEMSKKEQTTSKSS